MPRAAIRFAEAALADPESILAWCADQCAAELGERLLAEILASIESLSEHPEPGRIVPEFRRPFLREWSRPPFRIVHRRDPDPVRVVRVWRSERPLTPAEADGRTVFGHSHADGLRPVSSGPAPGTVSGVPIAHSFLRTVPSGGVTIGHG